MCQILGKILFCLSWGWCEYTLQHHPSSSSRDSCFMLIFWSTSKALLSSFSVDQHLRSILGSLSALPLH